MELKTKTEERVLALRQEAFKSLKEIKYSDAINKMLEAWNLFPQPRENVTMSNVIAQEICKIYLVRTKEYEKALKWANILQKYYETSGAVNQGEGEFWKGKIYFEMGNMEEAQKQFGISFQKAEGRGWKNVPQEYIDLLKKK